MLGSTILLFFLCFFWRSGLLECWIRSYVRGPWFGCSLRPGTQLNSPWTLDSSALSWSLTLPIEEQQGSCSRTNAWQLSTYPRRRIAACIPHGNKASLCANCIWCRRSKLLTYDMSTFSPVIFVFSPVSQSAGRHKTRACALDDAWPWPHGSTMFCKRFKLCRPPLEASESLMVPISMSPNDLHRRSVGLEEGGFGCAVA